MLLLAIGWNKHWLNYYQMNSNTMYPTYTSASTFFVSSLLKIKINSSVVYESVPLPMEGYNKSELAISRVVGIEGDTIQIINGNLYRNNKAVDDTNRFSYIFSFYLYDISNDAAKRKYSYRFSNINDSAVWFNGSYLEINKLGLNKNCWRYYDTTTVNINVSRFGSQHAYKKWTINELGPVVVPPESYFLMCDNRSYAVDSRYEGFIHRSKIIARIIN